MSETEPVLDPVPVTKDISVVNGNSEADLPPPEPELQNGINKPDMEMSNGVDESNMNGDNIADGEPGPINGDFNGPQEVEAVDLMGDDELPPPPEVLPELPPPPTDDSDNQDILCSENDHFGSSVDPVVESSVDPDPQDIGEIDCVDENEDLMNVSDSETNQEANVQDSIEIPKHVEEVSEEELVSDSGLQDEVEVEIQNNQQNEEVEQMNEGQLIDLGEPKQSAETPAELSAPLLDLSEPLEPQVPVEPEMPVEPEIPVEPEVQQEEVEQVECVQADTQEPVGSLPEPTPAEEPESVPVVESPPEPVVEQIQEPEPVPVIEQQVEPEIPEAKPVEEEPQLPEPEPESMPQVGYAEPAIIVDNKPAEEEAEVPPPPPPPLVEETPPPPPPLDENIPLRRVSGSSTPNKQSPSKEIESPVEITAPVNVAVVSPQPESVVVEREPEKQPEPVPVPVKIEPVVQPAQPSQPSQPVAIVAPQVVSEEVSPPASPPGSPSTLSEHAPSEGERPEAEPRISPQVSQKVNKKNFKNKIKFGVDLVEASLKQLHFLYIVNKHPGLYEEWLFKKAIRRYEAFWLPLAAQHKKESLAAPLDIEWIWHCHMLAPLAYESDSKNIAGLVVEHKLMSEKDRTKSLEKSRKYWTAKYPNEPFEIDLVYKEKVVESTPVEEPQQKVQNTTENNEAKESETKEPDAEVTKEADNTQETEKPAEKPAEATDTATTEVATNDTTEAPTEPAPAVVEPVPVPEPLPEPAVPEVPEEGYEKKSSYNIFNAIDRQRVFFYQTSLSHFHDKHFLKAAQKRYQRFMFLKHQNPLEMIVPCYDIDLMWHSHQLHPSVYKHDTVKVLGQILHHDDSVNDRTSGSILMRADQKTRELWKEHFGDTFMAFGAMFRGDPPILCDRMSMITPLETYTFSTKKATVNLDKVQVEGLPEEVNKYSVKLAYGGYNEKEGPLIKQFKGNKKKIEFENTKKGLAHFVFDTKEYDRLKFNMSQQIGFACTGHNEELGEQIFSLMPVVENIPKDQTDPSALTETVNIDLDEDQNVKATFTATIETPKQGPTMLYMNPGNYETRFCIMPEQIVQMWGPIPLPRLPSGRDNHCIVASHKFVNHTGETTFTCRVIHSLPLLMSAVQVFYHSQMAVVAHVVGSDQIPLPSQLSDSKKVFSLNPADGQRAVLIKNQMGDWGLIRGQWTGFRKHQPAVAATKGKKAKKEVPWNPGTLSVSFYKCATGAWQHITLPYLQENFKFIIQDANIDLRSGTIEINSETNEVAENLSLGFSVALLHVLCQPRYKPPPPPEPIPVTVEPPPPSPETKEPPPPSPETKEPPPPSPETKEPPKEETEKPKEEEETVQKAAEGDESPQADVEKEQAPKAEEKPKEPKEPKEQPKTPKSPAKSEPPTPSKKMKEVPAIPTFELGLILAAGYNIEAATNDNIKKQFGANACAGCCALGVDVGVGMVGEAATEITAEVEVVETYENAEAVEQAREDVAEAGDQGGDVESPENAGMDGTGMEAMGDVGDAGAAACAAF